MKFPCIEHEQKGNSGGYANTRMAGRQQIMMHRLVFLYNYGYLPDVVQHRCDNPRCINPLHLEAGTLKSNAQDAAKKGRLTRVRRRLTDAQAREIYLSTDSQEVLAKRYNVSRGVIRGIRYNKTYREAT